VLGLDDAVAGLADGGGLGLAFVVALLLGLRHATDPDHLTAVSTLVLSEERHGTRRATLLGLAWGGGHALTMLAFGLPVVLFKERLPAPLHQAAEFGVGLLIVALAVRLLVRWRRGYMHSHPHRHGDTLHAHPHVHEHRHASSLTARHEHRHSDALGRSPGAAFAIGLVHGVGGSAGAGVLLVGAISAGVEAAAALVLFALAAALSMATASGMLGSALVRPAVRRRLDGLIPALGSASLVFGAWFAVGALGGAPYAF
jgi:ABC-type nickel/cobalt efflux system permease component RcnA